MKKEYQKRRDYLYEKSSSLGFDIAHQQLLALAKEGRTMVIVTHEMQFAKAVADRMVFLKFVKERLPVN